MKDFLEQCLRDLEAITGNRQLAYWEMEPDKVEAKRKIDLCVSAMVRTCANYPEISEEKKMKIIRRQMEEDQKYEALNARTISKWLDLHRQTSGPPLAITEEELTPASPEVADKYANQLLASLADFKRVPNVSRVIMEGIEQEDADRLEGKEMRPKSHAAKYQTDEQKALEKELHLEWIRANYDPITGKPLEGWASEEEYQKLQKP